MYHRHHEEGEHHQQSSLVPQMEEMSEGVNLQHLHIRTNEKMIESCIQKLKTKQQKTYQIKDFRLP